MFLPYFLVLKNLNFCLLCQEGDTFVMFVFTWENLTSIGFGRLMNIKVHLTVSLVFPFYWEKSQANAVVTFFQY